MKRHVVSFVICKCLCGHAEISSKFWVLGKCLRSDRIVVLFLSHNDVHKDLPSSCPPSVSLWHTHTHTNLAVVFLSPQQIYQPIPTDETQTNFWVTPRSQNLFWMFVYVWVMMRGDAKEKATAFSLAKRLRIFAMLIPLVSSPCINLSFQLALFKSI